MTARPTKLTTLHVGSVSYLNAKPLIFGLENQPDIELHLDVPANLLTGLKSHQLDIALLPTIDYQRQPDLKIVPSGGIGSDGPTLTVRIFSPSPIDRISTLACDPDSHTSVALARILLAERFGILPEMIDLARVPAAQSVAKLLIGDKVVTQEPRDMPYQLDLGAAWKDLTGLPFVFAVWTTRSGIDLRDLPQRLELAKVQGLAGLESIILRHAVPLGWPRQLATQYLSINLKFDIGPTQLEAVQLFHELAHKHGLIDMPRALELY